MCGRWGWAFLKRMKKSSQDESVKEVFSIGMCIGMTWHGIKRWSNLMFWKGKEAEAQDRIVLDGQ